MSVDEARKKQAHLQKRLPSRRDLRLVPCVAGRSTNFNKLGRRGGMPEDNSGWEEAGDEILVI